MDILKQILLIALPLASFIFWLIALVQSIKRSDLKHSKALYIVLLIFIAPLGMLLYFFMENRKGLGIASIIVFIFLFLLGPMLAASLGSDSGWTTVSSTCDNLECHEEKFASCTPVVTTITAPDNIPFSYEYTIHGLKEGKCEVTVNFLKAANEKWVNKPLTCLFNFGKSFQDAFIDVQTDTMGHKCTGPGAAFYN